MEPYIEVLGILIGYSLSCAGFYCRGRDMEIGKKESTKWTIPSFMVFPGTILTIGCTLWLL